MTASKQTRQDLKKIIEAFWELFEAGWGASRAEKRALIRAQRALGYKTPWDSAREKSAEVNPIK